MTSAAFASNLNWRGRVAINGPHIPPWLRRWLDRAWGARWRLALVQFRLWSWGFGS